MSPCSSKNSYHFAKLVFARTKQWARVKNGWERAFSKPTRETCSSLPPEENVDCSTSGPPNACSQSGAARPNAKAQCWYNGAIQPDLAGLNLGFLRPAAAAGGNREGVPRWRRRSSAPAVPGRTRWSPASTPSTSTSASTDGMAADSSAPLASRLSPLPHPPDLPGAGCEQICALVLVAVDFSDGNESLGGAGLRVRQSCPACATSHFPAIDLYVLGRRAAIV